MARTFMQLVIGAMDNFAQVKKLQTLLSVALNEADSPSEEACKRIALLVDTYLCQVEPWIEDLNLDLEKIREQLREPCTKVTD